MMQVLYILFAFSNPVLEYSHSTWGNVYLYPMITDIAVWDYDDDEIAEVAITTYWLDDNYHAKGKIYVLSFDGVNLLLEWESPNGEELSFQSCRWFDYDADGDSDLLFTASVTQSDDGIVGVYRNNSGSLMNSRISISSEVNWDPMDTQIGDFNFDSVLDVLVLCADREPQLLHGCYNFLGYIIQPVPQALEADYQCNTPPGFFRSDITDFDGDGFAELLLASMNFFCIGHFNGARPEMYIFESTPAKIPDSWFSCSFGPPINGVPSLIVGHAWAAGTANVFNGDDISLAGTLLPDNTFLDDFIEYPSDIELAYAGEGFGNVGYYLSISECGCIDQLDDSRTRNCRVVRWNSSGQTYETEPFLTERNTAKTEAFSTAWGSWDSQEQTLETFTFTISDPSKRLYRLSDAAGSSITEDHVVRLGLTSAQLHRDGLAMDVLVEYLGNGLVFLRETPDLGDVLVIELLTTMQPCVFYGRRGELTAYEVF